MKLYIVLMLIPLFVAIEAQVYKSRFDTLKVDDVISNKRLLAAYIKCVLDQGRCTPEGRELKSHITEALQNGCDKCTDNHKLGIRKVIGHLVKNEPSWWKELVKMYDPEGIYAQKYEEELQAPLKESQL